MLSFLGQCASVGSYADIQVEQAETGCRVRQLYVLMSKAYFLVTAYCILSIDLQEVESTDFEHKLII